VSTPHTMPLGAPAAAALAAGLRAAFRLRRGTLDLTVDLSVAPGETLALVGPNGAGKTTCLLALAGLLGIDDGQIELDGRLLDGGPGGVHVPPEARRAGVLFQDPLLFPHLDAAANVAFGLRARGVPRGEAVARAEEWLRRVGLGGRTRARPAQLSGGQAQRVALARALATAPRMLLLDEPLSAVDASARIALRRELRAQLDGFDGVRVLVAHDAVDAFAFADRIAVLEHGQVVQAGTPAEICARPGSGYVADLVGVNLFAGTVAAGVFQGADGGSMVVASSHEGPALAVLHPRAVSLFPARPEGSPRNVWEAVVEAVEPAGDRLRVRFGGALPLVAEVTPAATAELRLAAGERFWLAVKATEIAVYSA